MATIESAQQQRENLARERVFDVRSQLVRDVLTGAGVELSEAGKYKIRLCRAKSGDRATNIWLERLGELENGEFKKPLLVAVRAGGQLEQMTDNLSIKFEEDLGDMESVPLFTIRHEGKGGGFLRLTSFVLTLGGGYYGLAAYQQRGRETEFINLEEQALTMKLEPCRSTEAAGREESRIFGVTLPKESGHFFDQAGWLKTESQLEPLIKFWARRVDLSRESLSVQGRERFTEALDILEHNPPGIQNWLAREFNLVKDRPKNLRFEEDIEADAVQFEMPTSATVIRIHNILLPEPNSEVVWSNLARPKEDSRKGTLKIIIYADGTFRGVVTDGVVELKGYNTAKLVTRENLAAILAKIE